MSVSSPHSRQGNVVQFQWKIWHFTDAQESNPCEGKRIRDKPKPGMRMQTI
jgi:hypothetical protein